MPSYAPPLCMLCRHLNGEDELTCSAYPDGIPERILHSDTLHLEQLPDQQGSDVFQEFEDATDEEKAWVRQRKEELQDSSQT